MLNWIESPFKDWWKPSSYSKKRHYVWLMPLVGLLLLWVIVQRGIYNIWTKITKKK